MSLKRERKVDLQSMTDEQFTQLENALGSKFNEIVNKAVAEANQIAKPYGVKVKMAFYLENEEPEQVS